MITLSMFQLRTQILLARLYFNLFHRIARMRACSNNDSAHHLSRYVLVATDRHSTSTVHLTLISLLAGLKGVGGGGLLTLVLIVISDVVSLRERGRFQGITEVTVRIAMNL